MNTRQLRRCTNPSLASRIGAATSIALFAVTISITILSFSYAQADTHASFREGLDRIAKSLPSEWNFTTESAKVNPHPKPGEYQVEIVITYHRQDIKRIYEAVKLMNQMIREGRTSESDFAKVPSEFKGMPASYGSGFIGSVGKVIGYAAAETRNEASAPWKYRVAIQNNSRQSIGYLTVSHTDVLDLINGRISASDQSRIGRIYDFK